jgi:ataxin-3
MTEFWIYHERQEALLCGQHALNNLVQASEYSPGSLSEIALQLDQMELTFMAENNEGGVQYVYHETLIPCFHYVTRRGNLF